MTEPEYRNEPDAPAARRRGRLSSFALGLLLVVLTAVSYLPAVQGGFIWDDDKYVTENPLLWDQDGLYRIWFTTDSPSQYFPMVYTSFLIEYAFWELDPFGYHVTNIVIHCANALLLWLLLSLLRLRGAWLAAAIFALHPVQVESVAWITERKNVLTAFFSFLSLLAWLRFIDPGRRGQSAWPSYLLSFFLYLVALLSKTTACTLPAALVLLLWMRGIRVDWKRWLQIAPYVALGLAAGLLSIWWEKHHQGTDTTVIGLDFLERILIASRAVWFYLGKLVVPIDLAFSYTQWKIDSSDLGQYLWIAACLFAMLAIWAWRKKIGRGPIAALVFYAATLLPLIGFVDLYTFLYTYVADHYQYVACLGPIALFAALLSGAIERPGGRGRVGAFVIYAVLLGALGALTWQQSLVYKDKETLWRDTLKKNPDSYMAHNNLGIFLTQQQRFEEAVVHLKHTARLRPDDIEPLGNLGVLLSKLGRHNEAIEQLEKALTIQPGRPMHYMTHNAMGVVYAEMGDPQSAIDCYLKALRINPSYSKAHYNLGCAYMMIENVERAIDHYRQALQFQANYFNACRDLAMALHLRGRTEEAADTMQRALGLNPAFAAGHLRLGEFNEELGKTDTAVQCYARALEIDPGLTEARRHLGRLDPSALEGLPPEPMGSTDPEIVEWYNQGLSLAKEGRYAEAVPWFRKAVDRNPGFALCWDALGNALASQLETEEAIEAFRKRQELRPDDANVHFKIGILLLKQNKPDEAEEHFRKAVELDPDHALARKQLDLLEKRKK